MNMSKIRSCFSEAHFCVLPSQSNVYGMCAVSTTNKTDCKDREKVLVATLEGDIVLFEYLVSEESGLRPVSTPVKLNYLPAKAEVVSLDAFTKHDVHPTVVLGVTFIEGVTSKFDRSYGFSILTAPLTDVDQKFSNAQIATDDGLPAILEGIPCQVSHAQVFTSDSVTTVFIVTTVDKKIHVFKEHFNEKGDGAYKKMAAGEFFSELDCVHNEVVLFIDIFYYEGNQKRLTCTGSMEGTTHCFIVDVPGNVILQQWRANRVGPVTSIKIFCEDMDVGLPGYLEPLYQKRKARCEKVHVLVSNALDVTSVYRDVRRNGLADRIVLKNSYNYDSVLCACITDVDFDGKNEIILGTYGQKILAYKFNSNAPAKDCAHLLWEHSLQYPVYSLLTLDLIGDGLTDLAVLSLRGLHILQKDITKAAQLIHERLSDLTQSFKQLHLTQDNHMIISHDRLMESVDVPHGEMP